MDYACVRKRARELRKNQIPEEDIVLDMLRNRKLHGLKFLRQHPIACEASGIRHFFIADFYCAQKKLVLELDVKVHDSQLERDAERDTMITRLGLLILRIRNEEIYDMDQLKLKLETVLGIPSSPSLLAEGWVGGD